MDTRLARLRAGVALVDRLESRTLFTTFGGVDFPQGISSFADSVLSYSPIKPGNISAGAKNPAKALGAPDGTNVSLGQGGKLTLAFIDNVVTNSATAKKDLWIFEVGPDVESTFVFARPTSDTKPLLSPSLDPDGDGYYAIGEIKGSTRGIDIDAAIPGFAPAKLRFDAVMLVDDPAQGDGGVGTPGADIDAVGAIASSPILPKISVKATDPLAAETATDPGTFTFTRTGPVTSGFTVNITVGGTATPKLDYGALPTSVHFAAGSATATLVVHAVDDTLVEGSETVNVKLSPALAYAIQPAAASAVVTIVDNDKPRVAISAVDPIAAETVGGTPSSGLVKISRGNDTLGALDVFILFSGTATPAADFSFVVNGGVATFNAATKVLKITLASGVKSASITLTPKIDSVAEPTETIVMSLAASSGYVIAAAKAQATVKLLDSSAF